MRIITRKSFLRLGVLAGIILAIGLVFWWLMIRMPGKSFTGPSPALTDDEVSLRSDLKADVETLAGEIGERNVTLDPEHLNAAAVWIRKSLERMGYQVEGQLFGVGNFQCENLIATLDGTSRPGEIVVIGAHYDSAMDTPGANDNATGTAAVLALARHFADHPAPRTIRFALFVNEEPPWFQTSEMGSHVYARRCRSRGEQIVGMISLETMGCFQDEPGTQDYPFPLSIFYPSTGNFIGFVSNHGSRDLVRRAIGVFRKGATIPSEGGALPGFLPGVGSSDHWSFWDAGYEAIMVTDTAVYRYDHYHKATDTPDRIDYDGLTRVVSGLVPVVTDLATR